MSTSLIRRDKDVGISYVLLVVSFFGIAGLHRLYLGRVVSGLLWLFTGGLCGVGTLVDLFLLPTMVRDANEGGSGW
ncbi:MAG: TM2 domain-containing protein [Myxococcota bacterium]